MKLKNKVLVAALAITMTTGPSLAKVFSYSNIAYASEVGEDTDKAKVDDQAAEAKEEPENTNKELKLDYIAPKVYEYLVDHFKDVKDDLNYILGSDRYSKIDENPDFKLANEDDVKKLKDQLNSVSELIKNNDATKADLEEAKDNLIDQLNKVSEEILKNKLAAFKEKFNNNKSKLNQEDITPFENFITETEKTLKNGSYKDRDLYIENLDSKNSELDKAIKLSGQTDLKSYESAISEAKSIKEKEDYKRSSEEARKAFDAALTNLENYIKDTSKFKKDEADNLKKALETATSRLDGKDYFNLLEEAKKKLDKNKDKLGDKYDALLKTYNELADENNKEYTVDVDRVRAFSDDIDSKLKSATLRPSTNNPSSKPSTSKPKNSGVQVSAKKVAVPRAQNGSRKSAKSLVRTGIDSIKIFGVVAVVAVVLLLLTRNKSKNEKNDNEK